MVYILDTDILSLIQQSNVTVLAASRAARERGHVVGLSVVTVEEQFFGWQKLLSTAKTPAIYASASRSLAEAVNLWASFRIFPETEASRSTVEQLLKAKLNVRKDDLRIASVALDRCATLVTHNLVDFRRVPNLLIEDWAAPPTVPPAPP